MRGETEVVAVDNDGEEVVKGWDSTCFLERLRPRFMWRSQYLESGYASLAHRHFLPSVLLHLPGSGSIFFPYPIPIPIPYKEFSLPQYPTAIIPRKSNQTNTNKLQSKQSKITINGTTHKWGGGRSLKTKFRSCFEWGELDPQGRRRQRLSICRSELDAPAPAIATP